MKTRFLLITALALAVWAPALHSIAADPATNAAAASPDTLRAEEDKEIAVLQSDASPKEKDAACAKLKRIGTERSVPALAALLTDEKLSQSARYVLEPMQSPEAGKALLAALSKTSGMTKAGIINSLAYRGETSAVPALTALLSDQDPAVAKAAATALGQIGGPKALQALQKASTTTTGKVHVAVLDAILRRAIGLNAAGKHADALKIFQQVYQNQSDSRFRVAAYRGMIEASGAKALPLVVDGIKGKDGAAQIASLQMVSSVHAPNATATLAGLLSQVEPPVQIALIGCLAQRNDAVALPAVTSLANSQTPEVRLAVLAALGTLGNSTTIPVLAKAATSSIPAEQEAARLSLTQLRPGSCSEAMMAQLPKATPAEQAELARAVGDRRDTNAIPQLLTLARTGGDSARLAALQALGSLVDQPQLNSLVLLVRDAKTPDARAQAADAVASACREIRTRHGAVDLQPLAQELTTGPSEVRIALLPICSPLADAKIRGVLRQAITDSDTNVRDAAIHALCDTTDPELAPDVLNLAKESKEENYRTLGIRSSVRLATQEETAKLTNQQRLDTLQALLALPLTDAQKRIVLSGLAQVQDPQSLKLVEPYLDDNGVHNEAALAAVGISSGMLYKQSEAVTPILKKVSATTTDNATKQTADRALDQIAAMKDYIMEWQVAGPYVQLGKDYSDLFDVVFPPETQQAKGVKWHPIAAGTDEKKIPISWTCSRL